MKNGSWLELLKDNLKHNCLYRTKRNGNNYFERLKSKMKI